MNLNAIDAYKDIQEKYLHFLVDRTLGNVPNSVNDNCWLKARQQLKDTWSSEDPEKSLFASPLLPQFPTRVTTP